MLDVNNGTDGDVEVGEKEDEDKVEADEVVTIGYDWEQQDTIRIRSKVKDHTTQPYYAIEYLACHSSHEA